MSDNDAFGLGVIGLAFVCITVLYLLTSIAETLQRIERHLKGEATK